MKILNLSYDDYANFAHENANALRSIGVNCLDLKRIKHPFEYKSESKIATQGEINKAIENADLIQLFHSDSTFIDHCLKFNKRIVVYHTGTTYRMNPELCNRIFNDKVERCFTDQCEFIGLGMKNETYIATAIDTEHLYCRRPEPSHLFAHYPSNANVKGTDKIREMFEGILSNHKLKDSEDILDINTEKLPHEQQIHRMADCSCYVELFALNQGSKQYGCYGVTAFEAASLGCIVITNNVREDVYQNAYGECGFRIANTEERFKELVNEILDTSPEEIYKMRMKVRKWMYNTHGYKASGNYIKKCLNL